MGADCVLLIAACLGDGQMAELEARGVRARAWTCWWRCTTAPSSTRALRLKTPLVGINNRNLRTFEVTLDTTLGLMAGVPADRLLVTESGILGAGRRREDARGRRARLPGRRGVHARARPGRRARGVVRRAQAVSGQSDLPFGDAPAARRRAAVHRADDLPAAFAHLPPAWRAVLSGWTPAAEQAVVDAVKAVLRRARDRAAGSVPRAAAAGAGRTSRWSCSARIRTRARAMPTGWRSRPGHGKPVSLRRIFEILKADRPGWQPPERWLLDGWARQGVLMLNPVLTVEVGAAGAHMNCGWQALTADIVRVLAARADPPTFLLWGKPAQAFFDAACPRGSTRARAAGAPPVARLQARVHGRRQPLRGHGRADRLVVASTECATAS